MPSRLSRLAALVVGALVLPVSGLAAPPVVGAAEPGSIVVHATGDRDLATGAPLPLAGARLRAYTDAGLTEVAGECTTDAAGTCTITGLAPGPHRVAPVAGPPDGAFDPVDEVTTSFGGDAPYAEVVEVGEAAPATRRFAFRRTNPPFPARCGVRVTLLYDLSGSISTDETATMKAASLEFVDALAGTPSQVAIASFATDAPAAANTNLAPTSVVAAPGVEAVKAAIAALTATTGDDRYTNWDAAFRSVAGSSDIVVLFTDGNPTVQGVPAEFPPVITDLDQIEAGVLSANAVKAAGTRVLAVGVGDVGDISPRNLAAVSGPVEGSDYAITTFANVGTVFRTLADALCPKPEVPVVVPPAPVVEPVVVEVAPAPVPVPPRFTG